MLSVQRAILLAVAIVCATALAVTILLIRDDDRPKVSDGPTYCPPGADCGYQVP